MKLFRTAACGVAGIFCAGILQSSGSGNHAGSPAMTFTSVSMSLNPTSVIAGSEKFTLTRSGGIIYTDIRDNNTDKFNASFIKQTTSASAFTFVDPLIHAGYAPPGIQAVAGSGVGGTTQIFVSFAQQFAHANAQAVSMDATT